MKNYTISPALFISGVVLVIAAAIAAVSIYAGPSFAAVTSDQQTNITFHYKQNTFFTATTTTATSTNDASEDPNSVGMDIRGAKKVTMLFSRGGATSPNTGSSRFEVEVSPDGGTTWLDFNRLILTDVSRTATSTVWITAATSTVVASLDNEFHTFSRIRCQVVEVTDGEHTCKAVVEF